MPRKSGTFAESDYYARHTDVNVELIRYSLKLGSQSHHCHSSMSFSIGCLETFMPCCAVEYQAEAVQHLHFANNAVRIGVLGSI